jgi:1,4-alpha-glucan branching enzyme
MVLKADERVTFTFSLSSKLNRAYLVGDFNGWELGADPMDKVAGGTFRRTLRLPAGRYEYKFFADGIYWDDLDAPDQTINSYGTRNAVVYVD